jgi:hypothetical protein
LVLVGGIDAARAVPAVAIESDGPGVPPAVA